MIPTEWLGHRRASDGELVGYLVPGPGENWTPVTVLGTPVPDTDGGMDLDDAERRLEEIGLSQLAERWRLQLPELAAPITVRILEASPAALTVMSVGLDDEVEYGTRFTLDVPVTAALQRA